MTIESKSSAAHRLPFRFEDSPLLWTVDDVLTEEECAALIRTIESSTSSLVEGDRHYRSQDRVTVDDAPFSKTLMERLRSTLPPTMGPLHLRSLSARLRLYRYRPGQRFAPHMDHWYQFGDRIISLHTVLVYLNHDFAGGETRFTEQVEETVQPRRGRAAVWQHKLNHEGLEVLSGTKYALRSDVFYACEDGIIEVEGGYPDKRDARDLAQP
jgi:prolyl 4-hydroxylase